MLVDVTEDEFETFIDVLGKVNYLATPEGAQQIVDIISEQADLQSEFQVWMGILPLLTSNMQSFVLVHGTCLCLLGSEVHAC